MEVACGSGIGLSYLATFAQKILGVDIDENNLRIARQVNQENPKIKIEKMDAHHFLLPDNSCDVILLYEAIYYLQEPVKFIEECIRVLRKNGKLLMCSVNCTWKDFHHSVYATHYFSIPEFYSLLSPKFSEIKIYGAFRTEQGIKARLFSFIKWAAVKLDLIPGSLRFRAYLKRIFIGPTFPLPKSLIENKINYLPPIELDEKKVNEMFKIVYVVGKKR